MLHQCLQVGWLDIQQMIDFETTKIVHKSLHVGMPDYLQGLLTRVSDKCTRELRNSKGCEAKASSSFSAFKKAVTRTTMTS